jgi:hypothetical protein
MTSGVGIGRPTYRRFSKRVQLVRYFDQLLMDSLTRQYDKLIGSSPYPLYYANIKFNTTAELKSRSYVGEGELILIHRWFAVDCRMVAAIAGPLNLHSPKPKILHVSTPRIGKRLPVIPGELSVSR